MTSNTAGTSGEPDLDLAALKEDIARLTETIRGLVQHQARAAGSRVAEAVSEATDRARAASGDIEAKVERNPLTAVLVAFGIGMSIGLLSRSRR